MVPVVGFELKNFRLSINKFMSENNVVIIVLDKDNLTWDKIRNMLDTGVEPAMDN